MSNFQKIVELTGTRARKSEVTRLSSAEFISDFEGICRGGEPVIFEFSPQLTSVEELGETHGDVAVKVREKSFGNDLNNYDPTRRVYRELSLAEFLLTIQQEESNEYAGNITLPRQIAETLGASPPSVYATASFRNPSTWLGPSDCVTPLHLDSADNFAFHLVGAKRWTLYPPEQDPFLGIRLMPGLEKTGGEFAFSMIDIENPDLETYPEFRKSTPIELELSAGEVLYLPAGWHHHVRTLQTSLMMNYWVDAPNLSPAFLRLNS